MSEVRVNYHDLSRLGGMVQEIASIQMAIARELNTVQAQQVDTDNRVQALTALIMDFIELDRKAKELQLAETRLVKVRQELETTFGYYADVRRLATGILQALDAGLVTHQSIQSTTEDTMMGAPRYWLAPALVALAGWSRDDRDLAEKALSETLRRDSDKAALFFALVLRRCERRQAVGQWLQFYFERQDPTALEREFIVILDAVATGAFGPEAKTTTSRVIESWLADLSAAPGFVDAQTQRWQDALVALTLPVDDTDFRHLAAASTTWPALQASLAAVGRNRPTIDHFEAIYAGELDVPRRLEDQIDDLLTSLVSRFDAEELPLRRNEAELEAIIELGGDVAAAQGRVASVEQALDEEVDFPSLLTNAAMHAEKAGASRGTQRLAVAMSRDWIVAAHDVLTAATRAAAPASIDLTIDGWSGTVTDGVTEDALAASLSQHVDRDTAAAVEQVSFVGPPLYTAIGAVASLLLVFMAPFLIIVPIGLGIWAFIQYRRLETKRDQIRQLGEQRKAQGVQELRAVLTDLVDYRERWIQEDALAETARQLLLSISPEQYELSRPDDARMVLA